MCIWWPGKNCYSLAGKFWFICSIHQTLHLWIAIYFDFYTNLLMVKTSLPWKTVKVSWNSSLLNKIKNFGEDRIMKLSEKYQKIVKQNNEYHCSLKFIVKMKKKKYVFYFYLKNQKNFFGQLNIWCKCPFHLLSCVYGYAVFPASFVELTPFICMYL